jgi:hypothetical protein
VTRNGSAAPSSTSGPPWARSAAAAKPSRTWNGRGTPRRPPAPWARP